MGQCALRLALAPEAHSECYGGGSAFSNNTGARAVLRKSQVGITLMELVIVVTILVMLAGVGYPLYQDQVRKARRTDARSAAMQVALAQEQHFTRQGTYTTVLSATTLNLAGPLRDGKSEAEYYDIAIVADADSFTVTVTPVDGKSQKKDEDCQSFSIDQTGKKSAAAGPEGDASKCW